MNALHEQLIRIGDRILSLSRSELYLSMRFLDIALSALSYELNLNTRTIATDGVHIFYNPNYLISAYQDDPERIYGFGFAGMEVKFSVEGTCLTVREISEAEQ